MRGQSDRGRFDVRHDRTSMYAGITNDLSLSVGSVVDWYTWDSNDTVVDPIYDVGAITTGRVWHAPLMMPVVGVRLYRGVTGQNERGRYVTDKIHLLLNVQQAVRVLEDLSTSPESHLSDRFVYQKQVYEVEQIDPRGVLQDTFTVILVEAIQLKSEQLVNDLTFQQYAS